MNASIVMSRRSLLRGQLAERTQAGSLQLQGELAFVKALQLHTLRLSNRVQFAHPCRSRGTLGWFDRDSVIVDGIRAEGPTVSSFNVKTGLLAPLIPLEDTHASVTAASDGSTLGVLVTGKSRREPSRLYVGSSLDVREIPLPSLFAIDIEADGRGGFLLVAQRLDRAEQLALWHFDGMEFVRIAGGASDVRYLAVRRSRAGRLAIALRQDDAPEQAVEIRSPDGRVERSFPGWTDVVWSTDGIQVALTSRPDPSGPTDRMGVANIHTGRVFVWESPAARSVRPLGWSGHSVLFAAADPSPGLKQVEAFAVNSQTGVTETIAEEIEGPAWRSH